MIFYSLLCFIPCSSEYQIKLATVQEYEEALRYKKLYDDLAQEFLGLIPEIMEVLNHNSTKLKDRETLNRALSRVYDLVQRRMAFPKTPDSEQGFGNTKKRTEPISSNDITERLF